MHRGLSILNVISQEKDVLKLRREIEVLQNEVLEANNSLEQLRGLLSFLLMKSSYH